MNNSLLIYSLKILHAFLKSVLLMQACGSDKMSQEASYEADHLLSALYQQNLISSKTDTIDIKFEKIFKTDEEWREQLKSSDYRVLRNQETEVPFTNKYWNNKEKGIYYCRACGLPLFHSETKYKSATGWPSFWAPIIKQVVKEREVNFYFITSTEIVCVRCGLILVLCSRTDPNPPALDIA